jgi:TRAP-type transport system small permease protein
MNREEKQENWSARILDYLSALLIGAMVLAIFLQVVARYLFNFPLAWPEELGRFLFAWIVFIGIVPVLRTDEMPALDLIHGWLPEKADTLLSLVVSLLVLGFLLIMLKGGIELTARQIAQTSVALEIPMAVVYSVIPFSTILMVLVMIRKIIDQGSRLFSKKARLTHGGFS